MLPLYPAFIEPRLRIAELLLSGHPDAEVVADLMAARPDPAAAALAVHADGEQRVVTFTGLERGLPEYVAEPEARAPSVNAPTLREVIGRMLTANPAARAAVAVALIDPDPADAADVLGWLAERAQGCRLLAVCHHADPEQMHAELDERRATLAEATDAGERRFAFDVIEVDDLSAVPDQVASAGGAHLVCFCDLGARPQVTGADRALAADLGGLVSAWEFTTDPAAGHRPVIRPRSGSTRLVAIAEAQARLFDTAAPVLTHSPLLDAPARDALAATAGAAQWVALGAPAGGLIVPDEVEPLRLAGRVGDRDRQAAVFTARPDDLLAPVLGFLQQHTFIHPDRDELAAFLEQAVRRALPDGLLAFFGARGDLSPDSVLTRLGVTAALAYLAQEGSGERLVVSLDTAAGRAWLGLRNDGEQRADFVTVALGDGGATVEAVEVKARMGEPPTADASALAGGVEQVQRTRDLLERMFAAGDQPPLAASRREVLRRQVFLEALQQWEPLRVADPIAYQRRLRAVDDLFAGRLPARVEARVFVVAPEREAPSVSDETTGAPPVRVITVGLAWLEQEVARRPGATVAIPANLIDFAG